MLKYTHELTFFCVALQAQNVFYPLTYPAKKISKVLFFDDCIQYLHWALTFVDYIAGLF
jgi:hypothetical protein